MLQVNNLSLKFNTRVLFEDVNLKFEKGNCYGVIGANGAGKSTFLKVLSGELDSTTGDVIISKGERMSVLKQDHNAYDEYNVIETVIAGNEKLYQIMKEKDAIYAKEDFSEMDGIKAGELEAEFADLNGWNAESDAAILLNGLGLDNSYSTKLMKELSGVEKVKVLLARALFGDPDILILDEPTNYLDIEAKMWLEEFLINFNNTVIVVSHDRHFLNKVCTHMLDIDYGKITMFIGNYDFWYESSQLILKQMKESNKKKEEKIKELKDFIARFSANASKSKQATSRKKSLEKIELEEMKASSRKYPYVNFEIERDLGKDVLELKNISKTIDGQVVLKNMNLIINTNDKVGFVGQNELAITTLFQIISGELKPDSGEVIWGTTVKYDYFPKNHDKYFNNDLDLIDFLRQFSKNQEEPFIRGFLGRMLFTQEEVLKKVKVLSGGERVRCMLSKLMLSGANVLILDDPTNHLDIESITSLNKGMNEYKGSILFSSHDHQLLSTVANRIIEFKEDGKYIDKMMSYDEYLERENK
ncbi:MAG: ABC-F family ATP-binding cassette domain-containing protein [Bacilli bacterium]|nr:ABC-F family ATP-binding cassette domain-containing protein [Bacilli bacterium]MBO6195739.1 ABC-F family ATP-binding cassette domain-containing protein [Bacilli bacterium]